MFSRWTPLFLFAGITCALALLSSCSTNTPAPTTVVIPSAGTPPASGTFKAALITPCPINDGGWGQNAYKGLKRIEKELGAQIQNFEANSPQAFFENSSKYAADGANVVFGHASEWFDPKLLEIAKANPNTVFIISGCEKEAPPNVAGTRFVLEDATYVLGFMAGSMTKSNVIACVGGEKIPVVVSTFETFKAGAEAANPKVSVRIVFTENAKDMAKAKEMTLALINEKADFIFHNANNLGTSVFEAVKENKDKGVLCFGSNDDQAPLAPEVILASATLDIPSVFLAAAKNIKEKKFDGHTQFLGMPDGCVDVVFNEKLKDKIPAEVLKKTQELIAKIKKGEFKVERKSLK